MRYFVKGNTLFLRGTFRAASTGIRGGIGCVTTLFNSTISESFDHADPVKYLSLIAWEQGFSDGFFGLLTAVPMQRLCVLRYDFVTVFITAGIRSEENGRPGTINVIVFSGEGMTDAALLETIITVSGAKAEALFSVGYETSGTPTDAVIVATEDIAPMHTFAGPLTEVGRRVHAAVRFGVAAALQHNAPAFFIYSRYGGEHWVEWQPENCSYYPCHFPGQRCDFCYCSCYPCHDEELGAWVRSSRGGTVWGCTHCTLLHIPEIVEYIKRNPEASITELKLLRKRLP